MEAPPKLGLSWDNTADRISDFLKRHGSKPPRRAVFCTYDFRPDHFHRNLGPLLTSKRRPIASWILVDGPALQARAQTRDSFGRFGIAPVRCQNGGIFHPKLILLQAGSEYLAGVGSANLTEGGFGRNLELMFFADTSQQNGLALVQGAANFLDRLTRSPTITMPKAARDFVRDHVLAGIEPAKGPLLDSLDEPLLDQMRTRVSALTPKRIVILSPWHSATENKNGINPKIIDAIKSNFASKVSVYTEASNKGKPPDLGNDIDVKIRGDRLKSTAPVKDQGPVNEPTEEDDFQRRPQTVHAKAYLVLGTNREAILFIGSANCTIPGLQLQASGGSGNVELLLSIALKPHQAARFLRDLDDLFVTSTETPEKTQPSRNAASAAGRILSGELREHDGSFDRLEIEAPGVSNGTVISISSSLRGPKVPITVQSEMGCVTKLSDLQRLTSATDGGGFFYEFVNKTPVPFPVSFPTMAAASDDAVDSLIVMAEEELGIWRDRTRTTAEPGDETETIEPAGKSAQKEFDRLAKAEHQGRLDKIAVSISVLKKSILAHGGERYASLRFAAIRRRICPLIENKALAELITRYLSVDSLGAK